MVHVNVVLVSRLTSASLSAPDSESKGSSKPKKLTGRRNNDKLHVEVKQSNVKRSQQIITRSHRISCRPSGPYIFMSYRRPSKSCVNDRWWKWRMALIVGSRFGLADKADYSAHDGLKCHISQHTVETTEIKRWVLESTNPARYRQF